MHGSLDEFPGTIETPFSHRSRTLLERDTAGQMKQQEQRIRSLEQLLSTCETRLELSETQLKRAEADLVRDEAIFAEKQRELSDALELNKRLVEANQVMTLKLTQESKKVSDSAHQVNVFSAADNSVEENPGFDVRSSWATMVGGGSVSLKLGSNRKIGQITDDSDEVRIDATGPLPVIASSNVGGDVVSPQPSGGTPFPDVAISKLVQESDEAHRRFMDEQQKNSPYMAIDLSGNGTHGIINRCEERSEEIQIPHTIIPHRRQGKLRCLPHKDEGLVKINGVDKWAKGETTARNERRYVLQMQQGEWDYKSDGINSLKYELVSIDEITPKAKMINVKL
jgi:hypothetical protein